MRSLRRAERSRVPPATSKYLHRSLRRCRPSLARTVRLGWRLPCGGSTVRMERGDGTNEGRATQRLVRDAPTAPKVREQRPAGSPMDVTREPAPTEVATYGIERFLGRGVKAQAY